MKEPLAVVGIGCLFPESDSLEEYWTLIKNGTNAVGEIPYTHWSPKDYFNADPQTPDFTYGKTGAFLRQQKFDPLKYGISPQAVEATDTTQLLGMVVAEQALRDAGLNPDGQQKLDRVSCILGVTGTLEMVIPLGARLGHPIWRRSLQKAGLPSHQIQSIMEDVSESYVPWQEASFPGLLGNVVAGRIANRFNLGGTNSVVDAACASSLSAIRTAALELDSGGSDMVVTGGMDTFNDIFMYMCFSKTPALSPTGDAKPFDQNGDGTVLGEGLGAVVLKRLSDAKRDGNRIYATIRSIGSSSDGRGQAIYAPSVQGQMQALEAAYQQASISPRTVGLVECHGTGTKVGDGIELEALANVYRQADPHGQWCTIGSVKSQIGHTKAAAGVAGIIKATMALYHKVLPPTIKINQPHQKLTDSPFIVRDQATPWLANCQPRRAAVSAFGFGGSNFHCVLEEYEANKPFDDYDTQLDILVFSGETVEQVEDQLRQFETSLADTVGSLLAEDTRLNLGYHKVRLGVVVKDANYKNAVEAALKYLAGTQDQQWARQQGIFFQASTQDAPLAVLFPGQGAQYPRMWSSLMAQSKEAFESLAMATKLQEDDSFFHHLYPGQSFDGSQDKILQEALAATHRAQPAIGAVSAGIWKTLTTFGVSASMFAGHSFGELTALFAAGCYSEESLHILAKTRGDLMSQAASDLGGMMAIFGSLTQVQDFLHQHTWDIVVANHNAPQQVVVAGPHQQLAEAMKHLRSQKIRAKILAVGAAFHSPIVAETAAPLLATLQDIPVEPPLQPVYSNTTGEPYPLDPTEIKQQLAQQLACSVKFVDEIRSMYRDGARVFLELGPSSIQSGLVQKILADHDDFEILQLDSRKDGSWRGIAEALLQLYCCGQRIDFKSWQQMWKEPKPPEPRYYIPVTGANYRPTVDRDEVHVDTCQSAPVVFEPDNVLTKGGHVNMENKETSPKMKFIEDRLVALQEQQKYNADLHQTYLNNQARSHEIFHELLTLYKGGVGNQNTSLETPVEPVVSARDVARDTVEVESHTSSHQPLESSFPAIYDQAITSEGPEKTLSDESLNPKTPHRVLSIISEKTGYPAAMLTDNMSLDDDLGIDSIKRVEIFSSLQDVFPVLASVDPEDLASLVSIRDIINFIASNGAVSQEDFTLDDPEPITYQPEGAEGNDSSLPQIFAVIADKTGYPVDMLQGDMSLEDDLGIDSIKRVEIFSELQNQFASFAGIDVEELGEIRTLAAIADKVDQHLPQSVSSAAPSTEPKVSINDVQEAIEVVILQVLAEKTGYPQDMLSMDLNLETDLGIDSIKRVEIFSSLGEHFPVLMEFAQEDIAALETLGDIKSFIDNNGQSLTVDERFERGEALGHSGSHQHPDEALPQVLDAEAKAEEGVQTDPVVHLPRQVLSLETFSDLPESSPNLAPGAKVWVCDDGSNLARNLVLKLREEGFKPKLVSTSYVTRLKVPEELDGLIILGPLKLDGNPSKFLVNCFKMQKLCAQQLSEGQQKLFGVVTRNGASFGLDGLETLAQAYVGAMGGLAKTASREWPNTTAFHIDMARDFSDGNEAASRLIYSLLYNKEPELGVASQHYTRPILSRETLDEVRPLGLGADDIILITGGARGVTAELAREVARRYQSRIVLWGRTEMVQELPEWAEGNHDEASLKALIVEYTSSPSPKDVQVAYDTLVRKKELRETLKDLQDAGSEVLYQAVDVTQEGAMREALDQIESSLGTVTAVIHGAGVIADKLIVDTELRDFQRVLDTKVKILPLIEERLKDLKYLALFSSSTARFGRKGQLAYGVANEVLNKFAAVYGKQHPQSRVLAMNWGPWDGGMVHDGLKKLFLDEDIQLIPKPLGIQFLLDELGSGSCFEVVAVASTEDKSPRSEFFKLISFDTLPILHSHIIKHKGVVPTVALMELMIQHAQSLRPELVFSGFEDFKILKGLTLSAQDQYEYRIDVIKESVLIDGLSLAQEFKARKRGEATWFKVSSGTIILLSHLAGVDEEPSIDILGDLETPQMDDVYGDYLFHGDELQGLTSLITLGNDGIIGTSLSKPSPSGWFKDGMGHVWAADPLALDVAFQLGVIWSQTVCGVRSLPTGFRSYRQLRDFPSSGCEVRLAVSERKSHGFSARIEFVEDEKLIAVMEGYEGVMDESLTAAFEGNILSDVSSSL